MYQAYQTPLNGDCIGVVFGCFAPLHQGHLELIMQAKKECDGGVIVICCGFDGDRGEEVGLPHKRRYRYVREFFSDDDLVAVGAINDTELGLPAYPNGWVGWLEEFKHIAHAFTDAHCAENVEYRFYVGEQDYYNYLVNNTSYSAVLVNRTDNPISATMIRQNPVKHWDKIAMPFRRAFSHNILVMGTASEGKTTLCKDLGKFFGAPYSYEWARVYMEESCVQDTELDGADFLAFLEGQFNLNKSMINSPANHGIFIADTDAMVTLMYALEYAEDPGCAMTKPELEAVVAAAKAYIAKERWDTIFLLPPRGKFVDDHTRYMEHADMDSRNRLMKKLMDILTEAGFEDKVIILNEGYAQNFQTAKKYIAKLIEEGRK